MDARQLVIACNKEDRDDTTDKNDNQKYHSIESEEHGSLNNGVGKIPECDTR